MLLGRVARLMGIVLTAVLSPAHAQTVAAPQTAVVEVNGLSTHYHVAGPSQRAPGTPVVVFLTGANVPLDVWRGVLGRLEDTIPRLTYDRPGVGRSGRVALVTGASSGIGRAAALGLAALLAVPAPSDAVTVIISGGFFPAYREVLPEFERTTGITVRTASGASQGTGPDTIGAMLGRGSPVSCLGSASHGTSR